MVVNRKKKNPKFQGLHLFLLHSNFKMILTGLNSGLKLTIRISYLSCQLSIPRHMFIPSHFS